MTEAQIIQGHVLDVLASLPPDSVSCVVTSPPYWSLRKYDCPETTWGGDPNCPHTLEAEENLGMLHRSDRGYSGKARWQHDGVSRQETPEAWVNERTYRESAICSRCGAWRGQLGLEPEPDCLAWARGEPPCARCYICHTRTVLAAIRRVLRTDGVVWWNIGDGYSGSWGDYVKPGGYKNTSGGKRWTRPGYEKAGYHERPPSANRGPQANGLKPKDLILMPERIALAAQADGWWVRSRIIWHKPNAMPESTRDRPTDDHEHIWMLTKSARYSWDQEAVREGLAASTLNDRANRYGYGERGKMNPNHDDAVYGKGGLNDPDTNRADVGAFAGRNLRTVWSANEPLFRLRDDLSPDERSRVLHWLLEHHGIDDSGGGELES